MKSKANTKQQLALSGSRFQICKSGNSLPPLNFLDFRIFNFPFFQVFIFSGFRICISRSTGFQIFVFPDLVFQMFKFPDFQVFWFGFWQTHTRTNNRQWGGENSTWKLKTKHNLKQTLTQTSKLHICTCTCTYICKSTHA